MSAYEDAVSAAQMVSLLTYERTEEVALAFLAALVPDDDSAVIVLSGGKVAELNPLANAVAGPVGATREWVVEKILDAARAAREVAE